MTSTHATGYESLPSGALLPMTPTRAWVVPITGWSSLLPICSRFGRIVSDANENPGQKPILTWVNMVGDTGIEPVTSTVSRSYR
jgi:hypothetical protein